MATYFPSYKLSMKSKLDIDTPALAYLQKLTFCADIGWRQEDLLRMIDDWNEQWEESWQLRIVILFILLYNFDPHTIFWNINLYHSAPISLINPKQYKHLLHFQS